MFFFFFPLLFLDDDLDPFWPALHCFLVILDRLGSKIWGQIEPLDAFQAITKADSYIAKIKNIQQQTAGYDAVSDFVTMLFFVPVCSLT